MREPQSNINEISECLRIVFISFGVCVCEGEINLMLNLGQIYTHLIAGCVWLRYFSLKDADYLSIRQQ